MSSAHDALELELRLIPGVRIVGFGERNGVFLVQVGVAADVDEYELRHRATAVAAGHLERDGVFTATNITAKCASKYAPQQQGTTGMTLNMGDPVSSNGR